MILSLTLVASLALSGSYGLGLRLALADESSIHLKQAPGRDKVMIYCMMCHSLDYIEMNSGFLGKDQWQAVVNKMIQSFGAPIGADDSRIIVEYLAKNYGNGSSPSSSSPSTTR